MYTCIFSDDLIYIEYNTPSSLSKMIQIIYNILIIITVMRLKNVSKTGSFEIIGISVWKHSELFCNTTKSYRIALSYKSVAERITCFSLLILQYIFKFLIITWNYLVFIKNNG